LSHHHCFPPMPRRTIGRQKYTWIPLIPCFKITEMFPDNIHWSADLGRLTGMQALRRRHDHVRQRVKNTRPRQNMKWIECTMERKRKTRLSLLVDTSFFAKATTMLPATKQPQKSWECGVSTLEL
jgi:hypothetical protein